MKTANTTTTNTAVNRDFHNDMPILKSGCFNGMGDQAVAFWGVSDFGTFGWFLGVLENDLARGNPLRTKIFLGEGAECLQSEAAEELRDWSLLTGLFPISAH